MAAKEPIEESETTKFLEAAKDFSFEQKLSVVQSILAKIPREQQHPWNVAQITSERPQHSRGKAPRKDDDDHQHDHNSSSLSVAKVDEKGDCTIESEANSNNTQFTRDVLHGAAEKGPKYQAPPLIDPYEKSMRYYEKHVVLNHFQHMTAKLVLERPENTLQFMIDWCREMQKKQEETKLKSKTLYENNEIDVYDEQVKAGDLTPTAERSKPSDYEGRQLEQVTAKTTAIEERGIEEQMKGAEEIRADNPSDSELSADSDNDSISVSSASETSQQT